MAEQPLPATTNTAEQDTPQWGQVLEFPGQRTGESEPVRADSERVGEGQDEDVEVEGEPGAEVTVRPDATPAAPERSEGRVPPALRRAGQVAKPYGAAALHGTRRTASITRKGMEDRRQQRRAERDQHDLKAARTAAAQQQDFQAVRELTKQMTEARTVNAEALGKRVEVVWQLTKKTAVAIAAITGVALLTGTVNSFGDWLGPWDGLDVLYLIGTLVTAAFTTVEFVVTNFLWIAPAALAATAAVWVSRRYRDGKKLGEAVLPAALRKGDQHEYTALDESVLAQALANIGLSALRNASKEGWPNRETDRAWVQWPIMDTNGVSASLRLPHGAPVEEVEKKKTSLAHNLGCLPAELFLDKGEDPSVLELFRLNPGELRKPAPRHPLLDNDEQADFFKGVPAGVTPRGTPIKAQLFERNHVMSGIMGSGKSTLLLDIVGGALTDPIVDVDVFCFGENSDYNAWSDEDLLSTFVMGDSDETREAADAHFDELIADMNRRGKLLQKHGIKKVTREAAQQEPGLRPRLIVLDECQGFFRVGSADERRQRADKVVQFFSAARKYGLVCLFVTPIPSDQSLPRDLVAATSNRACFAIGDKTRNNVVLGDKAHENGISALGLKPADEEQGLLNDVGTCITIGYSSAPSETLKCHFLNDKKGEDKALAAKAREIRTGRAASSTTTGAEQVASEGRDLLEDLDQVLGSERVSVPDAVALLRGLAPNHQRYRDMKGKELAAELAELGVKVVAPGNRPAFDPLSVRQAAARRAAAEMDTDDGDDEVS